MKARDILMLPFHTVQLASGAKSFVGNPVIGSKRLNKAGLHVGRVRTAMAMAERRRRRLAAPVAPEHRAHYEEHGYVRIENFLPDDVFAAVRTELETTDFQRYDMLQGRTVTRRAMIDDVDLRGKDGLAAAKADPRLRNLIRYVASAGGEPLLTLQIVMALPSPPQAQTKGIDPQTVLHSDTFQPTAKAWLFLNDVGEDDGPFSYVPGSHRMTPERLEWEKAISEDPHAVQNTYSARGSLRITAEELGALGYGPPVRMTVPANTLIVADTHGFHARSPSPKATTRYEIYGSLRRNPFLPYTGLHPASLPFIRGRTNRAVTDGLALLNRFGLRGNPWHDAGRGRALEWSKRLPGA